MKWFVYWIVIVIGCIGAYVSLMFATNDYFHPFVVGQIGGLWFVFCIFISQYIMINWKIK